MGSQRNTKKPSVRQIAAHHFTRLLSGQCTDEERREIAAWLDEAPGHWCAFQRIQRAWSAVALIDPREGKADTDPDPH
jgi:ferric-dicitrate binding protein FerR (iron transport regulator)